ncbi:thiolase family protein [Pararhizobium haloflavum]|uniref:thiolase family protein n=1 Tax=Pararhizobium haloflavum TaxID=2037914 RepID=UPI000C1A2823|nr:thiolase family protein [Pararhizobium haloflavum]
MSASSFIVGASMVPFAKHREASYIGLALPALLEAIRVSGIKKREIGAAYVGHAYGGMMTGQRILKEVGIGHIPVFNIDNACSGGASALHAAHKAIVNHEADVALVIGVEKLTQFGGGTLPLSPEDREVRQGIVMPAVYAMRAARYLHETEACLSDLARVTVKSRRHASQNPFAQLRKPTTIEEVLSSRPIAEPLTLPMCCPTGDGAAALVVVSERVARRLGNPSVRIAASIMHSGQVAEGFRDMTKPEITYQSASDAYEAAGIGPHELDMIELHDAFSIAEIIYYEALGLAPHKEGFSLIRDEATTYGGMTVVNPSGGLLSKGHPVGASGVAQVVEAFWQLTGTAGSRQIDGARTALTHVTGGGTAGLDHGACTIHILEGAAA